MLTIHEERLCLHEPSWQGISVTFLTGYTPTPVLHPSSTRSSGVPLPIIISCGLVHFFIFCFIIKISFYCKSPHCINTHNCYSLLRAVFTIYQQDFHISGFLFHYEPIILRKQYSIPVNDLKVSWIFYKYNCNLCYEVLRLLTPQLVPPSLQ